MKNLDLIDRHTIDLLNKHDLLKKLVRSEIIQDEVYSGECNSEELDYFKQEIAKKYNVENFEQLKKSNPNFSEDSISKNLLMEKYLKNKFENKVEAKFLEIKNSLDQVVYSIIRVKNYYLAQELYLQLIADKISFGELAREFSEGPEKETRGIIGPGSFEVVHPKLRDVLRTSEINQINQPITIENMHVMSRLDHVQQAMLDDQTKLFIQNLLFNEWLDIKVSEQLLNLQNKFKTISSQSIS